MLAIRSASSPWYLFASPKARYGGAVARPIAKVLVIGAAVAGLAAAGHPGWALALAVFSVVVNGIALHPDIARFPRAGRGLRESKLVAGGGGRGQCPEKGGGGGEESGGAAGRYSE